MSEQDKKSGNSSDEIDLRELFQAIGNFFRNIFINIMLLFVSLKNATLRNIKLIFALGILGGIVGITLNYTSIDYYKSSMIVKSKYFSTILMKSTIGKLNALSDERNFKELAKALKIEADLSEQIRSVSFEAYITEEDALELEIFKEKLLSEMKDEDEMIEKYIDTLKTESRSTYKINVEIYNSSSIDALELPIINYLKQNPYIAKRLEIDEENLQLEKQNLEEELLKLDSLKKLIFRNFDFLASKGKSGSNNVILSDEQITNPIEVFNESKQQYRDYLKVKRELFLNESFELVDGFTAYSRPESPDLLKWGFYSGLVGLGLAYLIIMLIAFNNYLRRIERENSKA